MAENTPISWCDDSWSPWEGCQKVSPGCDHCYAEGMNRWLRKGANWGPGAPRREYSDEHWAKALRWNDAAAAAKARRSVFPSVCDPFDPDAPDGAQERFWSLIEATPSIDWLLLTKRIGNVKRMLPARWFDPRTRPANVRIGATMVNQPEVDRDLPKLLALPFPNFVSLEPLLGPIDLTPWLWGRAAPCASCSKDADCACGYEPRNLLLGEKALGWAVLGGESGRGARSMVLGWAKEIVRDCRRASVPVHVKQIGAKPTNREGFIHIISDRAGRDMADWPEELRIQQFPEAR